MKCDLCEEETDRLILDHDHATGLTRGNVCHSCNYILGYYDKNKFMSNLKVLISIKKYLGSVKSNPWGNIPYEEARVRWKKENNKNEISRSSSLKDSKIHIDNKGGGRLYIPKETIEALGWTSKKIVFIFLKTGGKGLLITPEQEASA